MDIEYKKRLVNWVYAIIKDDKTISDDDINKKLVGLGFTIDSYSKGAISGVRAGLKDMEGLTSNAF